MLRFYSRRINNRKGFTLVELLVVIAILGILMAITIPRLGQYRRDASETASLATAAAIYNARATYLARHGTLSTLTDDVLKSYMADGKVPEYIGGELDDTGYGITAVFVKDGSGNFTIGYPDDSQVIADVTLPRFEAEAATLLGPNARVQTSSNASGGQVIGNLNYTGDGIEITVNTADVVAGEAMLVIGYSCALNPPGKLGLYINGTRVQQVAFVNTGSWNTFTTTTVPITLDHTLASNTIRLYRAAEDGPAIDIDYLDLTVKKYQ